MRRLWDFTKVLTEFNPLLSLPESCLLIVPCVGSRVIGIHCPSVTDGQIGEKHRDKGQWSKPWSCSFSGSCKLTRLPWGGNTRSRGGTATLVEVVMVAGNPSAIQP